MSPKHPLGRGLGALIRDGATAVPLDRAPMDVDVERIAVNALQPRQAFREEPLDSLIDSIRARGVLQPLLVRRTADTMYELIAGERRLRAATAAGLRTVPVRIVEATDCEALELALIENLQREDLNPIEEAEGYRQLADKFGMTQEQIGKSVGRARASVTNALRLLDLSEEVRAMVACGQLSAGHAKVLAGVDDEGRRLALARDCVERALSVRQLEQSLSRPTASGIKTRRSEGHSELPEAYVADLSERLHRHFGTAVRIAPTRRLPGGKSKKGCIELEYYSNDDLNRLLEIMGVSLDD